MPFTPPKFGPASGIDSKDYILHMEGPNGPTGPLVNLLGHGLTAPTQNLTDALLYTTVQLRNGRVQTISRTKRAAQETSRTYTVGFPSALWTPLMQRTLRQGCETTLYLLYNCSESSKFNHWDILPDAVMNPAIEAEDVITTGDETNIITFTSEITVPEKLRGWQLGYTVVYDNAASLNAVTFMNEDCPGCDFTPGQGLIVVGDGGVAAPAEVVVTEDRFTTTTEPTTGGTNDLDGRAVYQDGDFVIYSATDAPAGTATSGQVQYSSNRGVSWASTSLTDSIFGIDDLSGTLFFVGEDGTDSVVWISDDLGQSYTELDAGGTILPTTSSATAVAADNEGGRAYITFTTGELVTAELSGDGVTLVDISANLPGSPTSLNSVAILSEDHVIVGGASGYIAESRDAGATWTQVAFSGAGTVAGISGNRYRAVAVEGANLYERNAMTDNQFRLVTLEQGQTVSGNYTSVKIGRDPVDGFNLVVATSSQGNVIVGKPFYPGA